MLNILLAQGYSAHGALVDYYWDDDGEETRCYLQDGLEQQEPLAYFFRGMAHLAGRLAYRQDRAEAVHWLVESTLMGCFQAKLMLTKMNPEKEKRCQCMTS